MIAFLLFLVIIWIAIGIVGAIVHGLVWLTIIAAVLFVGTLIFGGNHVGRKRVRR